VQTGAWPSCSSRKASLRHFRTVAVWVPCRRASALTPASLRCIARRIAPVVAAQLWRTWPIAHASSPDCLVCPPPNDQTARPGASTAPCHPAVEQAARGAEVDGHRPWLLQLRVSRAHQEPEDTSGDPAPLARGDTVVPAPDLRKSQSGRATVGAVKGIACRHHTLRKDRTLLHVRLLPRRYLWLDQGLRGSGHQRPVRAGAG
jgi:hypothetical protein